MKVLHLIINEKFTKDYIDFFIDYFSEYDNNFIVLSEGHLNVKELLSMPRYKDRIIIWNRVWDLVVNSTIRHKQCAADLIIISGFAFELPCFFWRQDIWKKTCIQFWGKDFYDLINKTQPWSLKRLTNLMKVDCFKRAKGFIFLVDGEYEQFVNITGIHKDRVTIAPVPDSPKLSKWVVDYKEVRNNECCRILLGNSATKENNHIETLELLYRFKDYEFEVICPLSYGDSKYGESVAQIGNQLFGDRFVPVFDWMEEMDYWNLITSCDIGIFNTNRQQAMGNIDIFLSLGKKIYLNKKTSMYNSYIKDGYTIYDISDLRHCDYYDFITMEAGDNNRRIAMKRINPQYWYSQWDEAIHYMLK